MAGSSPRRIVGLRPPRRFEWRSRIERILSNGRQFERPSRRTAAARRFLVDALVVDARRADRDGPRPDGDLALSGPAVADHQPVTILIEIVVEPGDVLVRLGPERGGDHPPSSLAGEIVERDRDLPAGLRDRERANIHHRRAFLSPPFGADSVLINREGTPPSFSRSSTTSGYSSGGGIRRQSERPGLRHSVRNASVPSSARGGDRDRRRPRSASRSSISRTLPSSSRCSSSQS